MRGGKSGRLGWLTSYMFPYKQVTLYILIDTIIHYFKKVWEVIWLHLTKLENEVVAASVQYMIRQRPLSFLSRLLWVLYMLYSHTACYSSIMAYSQLATLLLYNSPPPPPTLLVYSTVCNVTKQGGREGRNLSNSNPEWLSDREEGKL